MGEATAQVLDAAEQLRDAVNDLKFNAPIAYVYNPLDYAWAPHEQYVRKFGSGPKRVVFLGMNPGPFGMAQTGVPFGEIAAVRDWLKIVAAIGKPNSENPKRPVQGFDCKRSEVSGRRLWGLFAERFGTPEAFFAEHFVANYCPLGFYEISGCNRTPDKLPSREITPVIDACDRHLRRVVEVLHPQSVIAIGDFAEKRAQAALKGQPVKIGKILHPSPASPEANRGWAEKATAQLRALGVWK